MFSEQVKIAIFNDQSACVPREFAFNPTSHNKNELPVEAVTALEIVNESFNG